MFFDLNLLVPFIVIGLFLDVFIFHHFREVGDVFENAQNPFGFYINCCLCHGFTIGIIEALLFQIGSALDSFSIVTNMIVGGCVISISALTYRILVLKE